MKVFWERLFSLALGFNDLQAVKFCIDKGEYPKEPISFPTPWGQETLNPIWQIFEPFLDISTCFLGTEDKIEDLITAREEIYFLLKEHGANIKAVNDENQNLLVPAIYSLSPRITQDLIENKAGDINQIDKDGLTPLDHALLTLEEQHQNPGYLDSKNLIQRSQDVIRALTLNGATTSKKAL